MPDPHFMQFGYTNPNDAEGVMDLMSAAGGELLDLIARVAAGEGTKPERLGHREYSIMYKHQNTPSLEAGCRV